jgi:hypothetical protein
MRRPTAAAAVLFVAVGAAACGGGSSASTTTTAANVTTTLATPKPPNAATLSTQLLSVGDLPAGWSTSPSSSGGPSSIVGCTVPSFKQNEAARAEGGFRGSSSGIPAVSETLASFSGELAQAGFTSGSNSLNACKSFSLSADGTTFRGTARGISLGTSFGNESAAWQLVINATGLHVVIDEVAVRIGDEDMILAYTATHAPDAAALSSLVGAAVDKVTGTSPPAATSTTAVPATTVAPAVNYGQQFLADVAPWDAALTRARGRGLTSPQAHAAGQAAAATARRLLVQTWPASDEADIHALAEDFELINADIEADDLAKYESDGTNLNAAANVVRAELGLPSVR